MSGLLLTALDDEPIDDIVDAMRAWPWEVACDLSRVRGLRGGLTRLGPSGDWAPAHDSASGLTVAILGHFVPPLTGWPLSPPVQCRGGSIPARLLALWKDDPVAALAKMNGACAWIILDSRKRTLEVVTDQLGIQPLYVRRSPNFILASDADVLAAHVASHGYDLPHDCVSQAEMLATGRVSQPFTYYRGVEQLEAASHYRWNLDKLSSSPEVRVYWRPAREDNAQDLNDHEAVEAMVEALRGAMRRRQQAGRPAPTLLLSGGLDSRALLFAAPNPAELECVTFCDSPNTETQTAGQIAAAVGATHCIWQRDADHYAAGAKETVKWSGGLGSIAEGHFAGFRERWRELSTRPLLTGCYADYLLKGLALNRGYKTFLGRKLPERTFGAYADEFYKRNVRVAPAFEAVLEERRQARFGNPTPSSYHRQALAIADRRIRPLAKEADCAGRLWLLRHMDWDPVFADSALVDLYGRLNIAQTLNGDSLARAARRISPLTASHIRDNNTRSTVGASMRRRNLEFIVASAARKARALLWATPPHLMTSGSWPDMGLFVQRSSALYEQWVSVSRNSRAQISALAGSDPWARTPAEWGAEDPVYFLRLLTLGLWLDRDDSIASVSPLTNGAIAHAAPGAAPLHESRSDR